MTFWRKKNKAASTSTGVADSDPTPKPRQPSRPPVKGTKVRLFLHPPGRTDRLLEVTLPDDGSTDDVTLRCFEPPPERGGGGGDRPSRAWVVDLSAEDIEGIKERAGAIRLLPLGGPSRNGDGSTVELIISAGPAEARLKWWMAAPAGWSAASELVELLRLLSGEEA